MLRQDSISRPRRPQWGVKKLGNDLRSTQTITRWVSARRGKESGCRNVTWHRKDSSLARCAVEKQSRIDEDRSPKS